MESNIIINEDFLDDEGDDFFNDSLESQKFESQELFKLRLEAEEISKDAEIKELISYREIKKLLEFDLPHQREGALKILRDMNGSGLLADEVGLGKTITGGIVLKECIARGFIKKALILTPPSLVNQWIAELREKFALNFKVVEREEDWLQNSFLIASMDRVKVYSQKLQRFKHENAHKIPWDILIIDEGHKLKNRTTARWKFVDRMQKKRFLILTATPFQNDLLELYNLLHILKRGHLGTVKEFRDKFLYRGNKRRPLNPKDLKKRLDEVMVRRKRSETVVEYMKRIPNVVPVSLAKDEKEVYDRTCDLLKTKYFSVTGSEINGRLIIFSILPKITSSSRSAMESLSRIVENEKYHEKTRKIAYEILEDYKKIKTDSKIEKLIEVIGKIRSRNREDKILIYTRHPTTLSYIVEKLKPYNLKIVEFTSNLNRDGKSARIKEFKDSAEIMVCTETGSEGLNLQFCNNLINYDLPWNPMSVEQRIGRLDRIGQKKDMHIYSLATKGTMEEHVVDLIINKMCCIGMVIGELPIILFNLGLDDSTKNGSSKVEEMLMDAFIDSKNNLEVFEQGIEKIAQMVECGIKEHIRAKKYTSEVLDAT